MVFTFYAYLNVNYLVAITNPDSISIVLWGNDRSLLANKLKIGKSSSISDLW